MNQAGLLFQEKELVSKSMKMYEWTCLVNGKEIKITTSNSDKELARIELARAICNAQRSTDESWLSLYYELEKTHKIEWVGITLT